MDSSGLKDLCQIQGEKDRKICQLIFPVLSNHSKRKSFILQATDFSTNHLGMMEVFIHITPSNKDLAAFLENKGYECLGIEEGKKVYLKDNILELEKEKHHESSR